MTTLNDDFLLGVDTAGKKVNKISYYSTIIASIFIYIFYSLYLYKFIKYTNTYNQIKYPLYNLYYYKNYILTFVYFISLMLFIFFTYKKQIFPMIVTSFLAFITIFLFVFFPELFW